MAVIKNVLIGLLFLNISAIAQDSLRFTNNEIKAVKVLEVGIKELKYKKMEALDGPTYIVNKSDVSYVKYGNGQIEKFTSVATENLPVSTTTTVINFIPLSIINGALYQQQTKLSLSNINNLIKSYPLPQQQELLYKQFNNYKKYISSQQLSGGLVALGFMIPVITSLVSLDQALSSTASSKYSATLFVSGVVVGAAARITGFALTKMYRNKRIHEMKQLAETYNNIGQ